MSNYMDVVVVGSCMIDLISYAPRLPQAGETLHGTRFTKGFGGKGCNQCVAARKLGAETLLVAKLGSDSFGREYTEELSRMGIPTSFVKLEEKVSTGMAPIVVADNGENQIVIVAGANNFWLPNDIIEASDAIINSKVLITQMEIPVSATLQALRIKASSEIGISIFNAAPAQTCLEPELYSLPTIFCVNETETELLTGQRLDSIDDAINSIEILRERGCQHVIITLGANGAIYASPDEHPQHIPAVPAKVVDTTGAGDAFIGALAFYISTKPDLPLPEAIRRACAVASLSVQKAGTQISFPTRDQLPSGL